MMFVNIAVHRLRPGKEPKMLDSMRRYCEAAKAAGGLQRIHTLKDERTGALIGLAIWDSREAYEAAGPALMNAVEGDDFREWHEQDWEIFHCFEATT
jgi:hypothetical protein